MSGKVFDIIIPSAGKDISFLPKVVKCLRMNLDSIDNIYIIANKKFKHKIDRLLLQNYTFIDEDKLINGLTYVRLDNLLKKYEYPTSTGWYLQQFLKLGFAQSGYAKDYYLSWDSDTLLLNKISFFEEDHLLYTPKKEYNPSYFTTINNLFGYGKLADDSFIAEHMIFKKDVVLEMLSDISQSNVLGDDWIEKILNAGDYSMVHAPFSEFELYGNYCVANYPLLYKPRKLSTLRCAGLIRGRNVSDRILNLLSNDLDVASFEWRDGPMFPYNIKQLYYRFRLRLHNFLKMPFDKACKKLFMKLYKTFTK